MTLDLRRDEIIGLVDPAKGFVDRRIFSSDDIYQAELEHIFARAWLFMAHDSQIPNPGDFFQARDEQRRPPMLDRHLNRLDLEQAIGEPNQLSILAGQRLDNGQAVISARRRLANSRPP